MDLTPRFSHPNRKQDPDHNRQFDILGKTGYRRIDGWEKVSGRAMFGSDFVFPGTLYARVLACPHAHAKITSMDTSKAEAYPGVRKIVRYDEPSNPYIGIVALPQRGLFEGEPMGVAVIADTDEIAQDALRLIEIEWEILPFALECVDALEPDFPVVVNSRAMTATTDKASNRIAGPTATQVGPEGIALGDVQEGFSQADHIIQFTGSRAENMAKVEPTHASFVYKDGIIEQACPGQFDVGRFVAIPTGAKNTYQHPTFSGGGFGLSYPVAMVMGLIGGALCQQVPGTPVKVMFDLQQSNFYTMSNDCNNDNFKVGFKDDGTITAVQCDSHINGATFESTLVHFEENTCVPNIQDNYTASWVNRPQAWACRSEQRMCITALNHVFSHVASELDMDPTAVAIKNDGAGGETMESLREFKLENGFQDRDSLKEIVAVGKEAIDFDNVWHSAGTKTLPDGRKHGIGFSWDHEWNDVTFNSQVILTMNSGKVQIISNRQDVGVNSGTTYCELVAEEVGLNFGDVYYKENCEEHGIKMHPTGSAAGMAVNGWALKDASQQLKAQILYLATKGYEQDVFPTYECPVITKYETFFPDLTADELDIKGGYVFEKNNPDNKHSVAEITTGIANSGSVSSPYAAPLTAWGWYNAGLWGVDAPHRERMCRQAHFVEIAVDTETGEIEVLKAVAVNDVGKVMSPESVAGQQYGATIMGISRGRGEEAVYDLATGVKLNANLLDYKTSTIEDCGPIETYTVETALGYGPYGLVGVAEANSDTMSCILGPALQNAIGVWIDDYPITPEKVLKALGKA